MDAGFFLRGEGDGGKRGGVGGGGGGGCGGDEEGPWSLEDYSFYLGVLEVYKRNFMVLDNIRVI